MKRVLMVSMAALLAGAMVTPVAAQDVRARVVAGESARDSNKGPVREDRREQRRDDRNGHREDRREDRRDWRADNRDNRRDWQADRRDNRRDWQADRRDNRRDWQADRRDYRHDRRDDRRDWREDRRDNRRYVRHDDRRWRGYQWRPEYRYRAPARYVYPAGYRQVRWSVGHRMPPAYYGRPYYVDYGSYRLPPPPYGHRWVRSDRDVVLVALATGLVLDVLYDLYY
ncbi:RcnB family protein [Arenimonas sp.]|uniref:RcnB family protein n=1 Tax=Arenimonas sp. TaxID=1872635 RepID=UPI0035B3CBD4